MYLVSDPLKSMFKKSITLEAGLYAIFDHKLFWTSGSRFVHRCTTSKSENFHLSPTTIGDVECSERIGYRYRGTLIAAATVAAAVMISFFVYRLQSPFTTCTDNVVIMLLQVSKPYYDIMWTRLVRIIF